ncbi:MAG TPA: hypothetical protein DEP07_11210 [Brevibacillus sp.]|uniref:hypothetical protein n=1 Tax=Brevibacillus TaxID=55080 RepID=UPI000EE471FF|nr:hypothetical protein [Brevibacillus sp.]HBZ80941.1 hypothetical protein [Brevibacillus sp.]
MKRAAAGFHEFMTSVDAICQAHGINRQDYSNPAELFYAMCAAFSVDTLLYLDKRLGNEYLQDDIPGMIHQAVRRRLRELGLISREGVLPA